MVDPKICTEKVCNEPVSDTVAGVCSGSVGHLSTAWEANLVQDTGNVRLGQRNQERRLSNFAHSRNDKVRVYILHNDTLVGNFLAQSLGPGGQESLTTGVDGKVWRRYHACKRTKVKDEAVAASKKQESIKRWHQIPAYKWTYLERI